MKSLRLKRFVSQILVASLAFTALNGSILIQPQPANAATNAIFSEADAYVDGGNPSANYNDPNFNLLSLKEDSNLSVTRRVFMRFNLSALPSANALTKAEVKVYAKASAAAVSLNVYAVDDNAWDQTTINWNNKPSYGAKIGTINVGTTEGYYSVDLTEYFKAQKSLGIASIMIANSTNTQVQIYDTERPYDTQRPKLEYASDDTPPVYQSSAVGADFKDIQLTYKEALAVNDGVILKDRIYLATDGANFNPLGADDTAAISGNGIRVSLQQALSGSMNKIRVAGSSVKDAAGNILSAPVTTEALIGMQDASAPAFLSATVGNNGKSVALAYDKPIRMAGTADQLKASITLSQDEGATYASLQSEDQAAINGNVLTITFNQALIGIRNKLKVVSGALQATGNAAPTTVDTVTANLNGLEQGRTITAMEDARVDSGAANLSSNYGTESAMLLKEGGSTFNRRIFFKFNVASLGINNSAKLRLNFTDAGAAAEPLTIYAVDDAWSESELTYANQPLYGSAISASSVGGGNGWYEWDVTSYVEQQKLADGIASFVLLGTPSVNRTVSGKESGANAPQLVVNYDNEPPSYVDSVVGNENRTINLQFSESLGNRAASPAALKTAVTIARDGMNFAALESGDQVTINGTKLTITLVGRLSAPGAKVQVAANTLQDSGQNVLASVVTTNALAYDVTAPVLNPVLLTDQTGKQLTLSADEALLSNMASAEDLKNAVKFSADGTNFLPLASGDTVEIAGGKLKVTRALSLSGDSNKLLVAANALKDAAGNVVAQSYLSDAVASDISSPQIQSAYPSNFNKKLTVVFSENAFNNLPNDAQLKQAIQFSADGGASYRALGETDKAILSGSTLTLILSEPLSGSQNKVRILAGTLKDAALNVTADDLTTASVEAANTVYPYLPPQQADLKKAMSDSANIVFGNKDAAEGSGIELKAAKGLSFIAEEIASGDRNPVYIDRYVSTVKKMLNTPTNMPNLQGGLDSRSQSPMLYSIALLWNDQGVMSLFTDTEKSKLLTLFKAGLISTAYTLNDYNESGNPRPGDRLAMNGDPNNWNGTGVNYWEPNLTIFFTSSFVLGLENVKDLLQNYDHAAFIAELKAQGLTKIKESFEKTTNFSTAATEAERLAEKADKVQRTIKPSNWSFKGVTLEQYLQNPFKLHEASQRKSWTHLAQEGDYMGQLGMGHEFDAVDSKGSRQSASYVVLGIDPSLQNTRLMNYFGFMHAPGNEAAAADIVKLQSVGVSDYYAKVVNGYFTQSSYEIVTSYLPENFYINSMMSMGYLKPALFNDTFNYDGATRNLADNWIMKEGSWQAVNDSIVPYNTKDPLSHMTGAKPVDENEKLLKQSDAAGSTAIYTKKTYDNVSYFAWIRDMSGGETGLLGRVQDENDFYLFSYSNGKLAIKKKAEGQFTMLAEKPMTLNAETAHRLRAVMNGNSLELYVDGIPQLATTDASFASGAVGLYTNEASAKFDGVLIQNASVHAPDFQSIAVGNAKLSLTYSEVPGATAYKVKYGTQSGQYTRTLLTTGTNPVITGLNNDTTYYFVVSAIDPSGESANSREFSLAPKVPDAVTPTITNIISDGNRLIVNFTTDPKNTSYTLKYGLSPGSYTKVIDNISTSGYAVNVPVSQAPYYFAIEGRNANGASSLSNEWMAMANAATLFSDDFNDGEYASDWVLSTGSPVMENGKIKTANGNPERLWLPQGSDWSDYTVSATFTLLPDDTTKEVGLLGRVNTAANYYVADYKYDKTANTEKVMLRRKVNNAFLPDLAFDFTLNKQLQVHKMKAVFDGSRLKLYIDDVLAYDVTDTSLTKGTVGLFSVLTPVYFDDFRVEQLNGLSQPVMTSMETKEAKTTAVFGQVEGAQGYTIKYGTQSHAYTKQLSVPENRYSGSEIPGLDAGTTYYFTVSAVNGVSESPNAEEYRYTVPAVTPSTPPTSATPSPDKGNIVLTPVLADGTAQANVDAATLIQAFGQTDANQQGHKIVSVTMSELAGATAYRLDIPASGFLNGNAGNGKSDKAVNLITPFGTVTVPDNMFKAIDLKQATVVGISIGWADSSLLNADAKRKIGDKPIIVLQALLDGKAVAWKNNNAPVTVSIPYTPTAQELNHPEHIAIWYIDGAGQIIKMPARYDAASGELTFTTTHFSLYAVGYEVKTFKDLDQAAWAKEAVEVLTSQGIVNGTSDTTFNPNANISRADFLQLLIKALGLTADVETNFADVHQTDYYYEAAGIALTLGLSNGVGNGRLNPAEDISRQDMMVMVERAMRLAGNNPGSGTSADLAAFNDAAQVADYAKNSVQTLIGSGLVQGSGSLLRPLGTTTRAEAAMLLYRVYNQ
ncbi:CBM96 family carbohydrate-binding protein [Paenibacillus glycanilyticus]|uniref:CBM96 family carbohydrate-binding protein n=1 Tax=Paenibacillus glycanilyticus TaxID=126569 RepID=UPI000FDA6E9B|nr:DNRLRE domain-containing protein [Paenibacillus glycanilyticus]